MAQELTPEQKQKAVDWLQRKWTGSQACPVCGTNNWTVADHLVSPPITGVGGGTFLGGPSYPHVMLISNECGYVMMFNAIILGIVEKKEPGA